MLCIVAIDLFSCIFDLYNYYFGVETNISHKILEISALAIVLISIIPENKRKK
jgi:hypothetical protein